MEEILLINKSGFSGQGKWGYHLVFDAMKPRGGNQRGEREEDSNKC
jgi:hypothetical protein